MNKVSASRSLVTRPIGKVAGQIEENSLVVEVATESSLMACVTVEAEVSLKACVTVEATQGRPVFGQRVQRIKQLLRGSL